MKRPDSDFVTIIAVWIIFRLSTLAWADEPYELYDQSPFHELSPGHRAILEKDLSRLCGVNCLYLSYIWLTDHPAYRYADIMKMIDFTDGVTLEEILGCGKQIGLDGHARIVNVQYLLESTSSAIIVLLRIPDRKAHFVIFLGTKDKSSVYCIDYPKGRGVVSRDRLFSSFQNLSIDTEHIPVVEFVNHRKTDVKDSDYIVFSPSHIKISDNKPWLLAERQVQFETYLSNISAQRLELSEVKKSCGCTDVQLEKDFLEPGESTLVTGKIDVRPGLTKTVSVEVSTHSHHTALLTMDVDVGLPFETFQNNLSFGAMAPDDLKTLSYDVFVDRMYPIRLQETRISGKSRGAYELKTSFRSSAVLLKKGNDSTPYTKYTIECEIKTSGCGTLHAVHDLVLSFVDDDGIMFDYTVPIRFQVLEAVPAIKEERVQK